MQRRKRYGITAAACALIAAGAVRAVAATGPPAVGLPFTLASSVPSDVAGGASALGPDGTTWAVTNMGRGFAIAARSADGHTLPVVGVAVGANSETDSPVIAATDGAATVVWETQRNTTGVSGTIAVSARRCTLAGCAPAQTLASWRWGAGAAPPLVGGGSGPVSEPAAAIVDGGTVAVFWRDSARSPQMMWARSGGGRFGPSHRLAGLASVGAGSADPVLVAGGAGGPLTAVWLDADAWLSGAEVVDVHWSRWSPGSGFGQARSFVGGKGVRGNELVSLTGLAGTAVGSDAAIAWIEHDYHDGAGRRLTRVMVARDGPSSFTTPVTAHDGAASGLALADGGGVLALAFDGAFNLEGETPGPLMVERSADGAPFGLTDQLDVNVEAAPALAADQQGNVFVGWDHHGTGSADGTAAGQVVAAPASSGFGPPTTLGPEAYDDSPAIHTAGELSIVVWHSGAGSVLGAQIAP